MRLICLNGWGGKLHDELVPYISASDPDILCLQEVVHTPAAEEDWLSYRDDGRDLPQRANFLRDVEEALPDHLAIFCPASQGDLWHGETRYPSQWGWRLSCVNPSRLLRRLKVLCTAAFLRMDTEITRVRARAMLSGFSTSRPASQPSSPICMGCVTPTVNTIFPPV